MSDDTAVPWGELSYTEKQKFAKLCRAFVELPNAEDAERYYGDKEQLMRDAQNE